MDLYHNRLCKSLKYSGYFEFRGMHELIFPGQTKPNASTRGIALFLEENSAKIHELVAPPGGPAMSHGNLKIRARRKTLKKQPRMHSGMTSVVPDILTVEEAEAKRAWVEARYPGNIINKIAKAARFKDPSTIAAMKGFLIDAGLWYLDHKDVRDPSASLEPERDQLEAIAAAATKLEKLLGSLSDVSAISLWHPFHHISQLVLRMPPHFITDFGLTVIKRSYGDDGALVIEHLRPHQIAEAVSVLQQLATQAALSLPKQRAGQRQFAPRQNWITSAAHFWRHHSPIAFDPRSAAADFCYLSFRQLDRNVTEPQIKSGIRSAKAFFAAIEKRQRSAQESSPDF